MSVILRSNRQNNNGDWLAQAEPHVTLKRNSLNVQAAEILDKKQLDGKDCLICQVIHLNYNEI